MNKKELTWEDVKENLNFTPEEETEIQLEEDIIAATMEARKKEQSFTKKVKQKDWYKTTSNSKN